MAKRTLEAHPESGDDRRHHIVEWIRRQNRPVRGSELARHFHVSRQCVVQDMAILRAGGNEIVATPRGYRLPDAAPSPHCAVLACRHNVERTREELEILVDNGVRVLDVVVAHPLYGELRGSLMIESRADIDEFFRRLRSSRASLLLTLTGGVHLHTVQASRPQMIARARAQLREKGFLLK